MRILRVIGKMFAYYYEELFYFVIVGFLTLVCCLLVIPGPFALAGLWAVAQRVEQGQTITWQDYWEGVKTYGLRTWGVVLLVLAGYFLLLINLWFYNAPGISPARRCLAASKSTIAAAVAALSESTPEAIGMYTLRRPASACAPAPAPSASPPMMSATRPRQSTSS